MCPVACRHAFEKTGSLIDDMILAQIVCDNFSGGRLLEAGSGIGATTLAIAVQRPGVQVIAVEMKRELCAIASSMFAECGINDQVDVVHGDVLKLEPPDVDAVFSNPPLLPKELGFACSKQGVRRLFWDLLVEKVATSMKPIPCFLHLFDFHGLEARTGPYPSLKKVARGLSCTVEYLYEGVRPVSRHSKIRAAIPELVDYFPEGYLLVNGCRRAIGELAEAGPRALAECRMQVEHHVARLVFNEDASRRGVCA